MAVAYPILNTKTLTYDNTETFRTDIEQVLIKKLVALGINIDSIHNREIRIETVFYQVYWYNRLKNNPQEQRLIFESFIGYLYIDKARAYTSADFDIIFLDQQILQGSKFYVENRLKPIKTVDLIITKIGDEDTSPEILCLKRDFYPIGLALPGGFVLDTDGDNLYGIRAEMHAALRVLSTKIFKNSAFKVIKSTNSRGRDVYSVQDQHSKVKISIEPLDEKGFVFRENIKVVLRPSDPRHIVDTIAFKCTLEGDFQYDKTMEWCSKSDLMDINSDSYALVFNHHRELVNQVTAQSNLDKELRYEESQFIKHIIEQPLTSYESYQKRFQDNQNNPNTPFPELFPVISKLINKMYSPEINLVCKFNSTLSAIRDKTTISLRHVSLKNRVFCPYLPTIKAIFEAIAFFDIYTREQRGFYAKIDKENIHEHNPKELTHSSYHMYRYKYRMDDLLSKIPNEIIIPTFESFTATELMRVRCVPIRFVGLSTDFLYVDEFEQSPEEFLMHDINHNWRMMNEDCRIIKQHRLTPLQLARESYLFSQKCLDELKFKTTDTPDIIEYKKIKIVILFEIVHEDARPFLSDTIGEYIQLKEGGSVPFEVPRIDPVTNYMDMVDTLDTGISTLSYVRNKLQHGFYDQIDNQISDLVAPHYRTAVHIALAAYQMLIDYRAKPNPVADLDEKGYVSLDWLLKRVCAAGPENIHNTDFVDTQVYEYGDGVAKLNPKRYQMLTSKELGE
jgi:hypothetical protein